jgi:predicted dithiol-disulfide oxidoreductase (DUF899 family)
VTQIELVSRQQWVAARKHLLARESEVAQALEEVNEERRKLPAVKIDKEYVFEGPEGKVTLLDLFAGRRQLIVYHFMFDPSWDEGCKHCSFLVDNVGHLAHLHSRDTSLVLMSRAPLAKLEAFRARMEWPVPWYSSYGSDFNYDFHATQDEAIAPVEYNYKDKATLEAEGAAWLAVGETPGISVFLREGDGVFHTYSAYGGEDLLYSTYNYLDLTPLGRQDSPGRPWLRHHDRY